MSDQYTISAVSTQTRDYQANGKNLRVYYVKLDGVQPKEGVQAFELHQLQSSKPPEQGHRIDVKTFQEGDYQGAPFVKIIKDFAGRQGASPGGGQGSDERGESIERQVAAKVAGKMATDTADPAGLGAVLVISNFEAYFDAVLAKIKGGPAQQTLNGGEVPADMAELTPAAAAPDESIPF
jgi:hypothetical protein